jgi:aspartate/tyrosine/aromatic aminotransferase
VAYLGYASGSIKDDLYHIRSFAENKIEQLIAYSSAKNSTNYSDDMGGIFIVLSRPKPIPKIKSHLIVISRSLFSFVSIYGSRIIEKILSNEDPRKQWLEDQEEVFNRLQKLRGSLVTEFEKQGFDPNYITFLKDQKGIYAFLDLSNSQCSFLQDQYGIFFGKYGRLNLTGLKEDQKEYFVTAIKSLLRLNP